MIFILTTILSLVLLYPQVFSQNTQITTFSKSKKHLLKIYQENPITLYCGCSFEGKTPDFSSYGYIPKKNNKLVNCIEWEHVFPAHAFGNSFSEWRDGHPKCFKKNGKKFKGRKCVEKVNEKYRRMQADMYNFYPAIGEMNGRRSNYSMAIINGEKREFVKYDVEIENKKVEPKGNIRGKIAKTYLYMDSVYPGRGIISNKNMKLFNAWNQSDPVDEWECERAKRIERVQGNSNEIVMKDC